jgi:hypothetical protein
MIPHFSDEQTEDEGDQGHWLVNGVDGLPRSF